MFNDAVDFDSEFMKSARRLMIPTDSSSDNVGI